MIIWVGESFSGGQICDYGVFGRLNGIQLMTNKITYMDKMTIQLLHLSKKDKVYEV